VECHRDDVIHDDWEMAKPCNPNDNMSLFNCSFQIRFCDSEYANLVMHTLACMCTEGGTRGGRDRVIL
jgi:hypothetical protein